MTWGSDHATLEHTALRGAPRWPGGPGRLQFRPEHQSEQSGPDRREPLPYPGRGGGERDADRVPERLRRLRAGHGDHRAGGAAVRRLRPALHQRAAARPARSGGRRLRRRPLGRRVHFHPGRQPDPRGAAQRHGPHRRRAERHLRVCEDDPGAQLPDRPQQPHPGLDPHRHRYLGDGAAGGVPDQRRGVRPRGEPAGPGGRRACGGRNRLPLRPAGQVQRVQYPGDVPPVQPRAPGAGGGVSPGLGRRARRPRGVVHRSRRRAGARSLYGLRHRPRRPGQPALHRSAPGGELRPPVAGERGPAADRRRHPRPPLHHQDHPAAGRQRR